MRGQRSAVHDSLPSMATTPDFSFWRKLFTYSMSWGESCTSSGDSVSAFFRFTATGAGLSVFSSLLAGSSMICLCFFSPSGHPFWTVLCLRFAAFVVILSTFPRINFTDKRFTGFYTGAREQHPRRPTTCFGNCQKRKQTAAPHRCQNSNHTRVCDDVLKCPLPTRVQRKKINFCLQSVLIAIRWITSVSRSDIEI